MWIKYCPECRTAATAHHFEYHKKQIYIVCNLCGLKEHTVMPEGMKPRELKEQTYLLNQYYGSFG